MAKTIRPEVSAYLAAIGSEGGKERVRKMGPDELSKSAKAAAKARWDAVKAEAEPAAPPATATKKKAAKKAPRES